MLDALEKIAAKYELLNARLADGALNRGEEYVATVREVQRLEPLVAALGEYRGILSRLEQARQMAADQSLDGELRQEAHLELGREEGAREALEARLKEMLVPPDPDDTKGVILEIRAGTGGEEAALFAGDLLRMYQRFADRRGWKAEMLSVSLSDLGGAREVCLSIDGDGVYGWLKFESGAHRVQRVPTTEAQGRIHTSAVTVAVLPEMEESEVVVKDDDLKIDTFKSGGAGGQHVNKTESAVRITHLPTGLVVVCQDERSQIKNRSKAMKLLRARLGEAHKTKIAEAHAADRKSQVGSGDRSERQRTYNFPQNRLTDHRVNLTIHALDRVMEGELEEVLSALRLKEKQDRLAQVGPIG